MKKVVVTNIYGKYNIGDYAIRNSAMKILFETYKNSEFYLLCESIKKFPVTIPKGMKLRVAYCPYGYAIDTDEKAKNKITKFMSLAKILFVSSFYAIAGSFSSKIIPRTGFFKYIKLLKSADVVVLMGGGYLITKNKVSDFFGVFLNVLPIVIAKFYRKKVIVLPISYGPFASKSHDYIFGKSLKNTKLYCRDKISLSFAKEHNPTATYMPDLALYDWKKYTETKRSDYFVLTVKDYLSADKQAKVENEIAEYIQHVWERYHVRCNFIPTGANPIEENDLPVGERLKRKINNDSIFSITVPRTPEETKKIISKAKFAICTRMHSAIFSVTEFTPFIAIAYEHKSIGLLQSLGLSKWYIPMTDVSKEKLTKMSHELLNSQTYKAFNEALKEKRGEIISYRDQIKEQLYLAAKQDISTKKYLAT